MTGGAGSSAFTTSATQNGETPGTVTIAYGAHNTTNAFVGTYAGEVTPSAATDNGSFWQAIIILLITGSLVVIPGAFTKLQILLPGETADPTNVNGKTGTPTSHVQTTSFNAIVNAVDDGFNIVTSATDVVHLTTTDAFSAMPADAALTSGTKTFSVTLNTLGTWTITASDVTNNTIASNTSAPVSITAISTTCTPPTLFTQNFSSSTTVANYIGAGANLFDQIVNSGGTNTLTITNGALQFARLSTGTTMSFSRTTDLHTPASTAIMYKFDLNVSAGLATQNNTGLWQVGTNFSTTNAAEATNIYAQFQTDWVSGTSWRINGTAPTFTTGSSQTITWVMNNTGGTISYTNPLGASETVGDDQQDLWVGTTEILNNVAVTTPAGSITDLKFSWNSGTGTLAMDNFVITDLGQAPTATNPGNQIMWREVQQSYHLQAAMEQPACMA